ncbi:protein of unknown function [Agrobacterium pusense]|uniref:Uncharacterized protein n=1 Tax=Agrobacterium pusense TaxID=648995 RepID=U4Q5Q4_9HYPH|nr:protein of unknown function [Agrobacterium pusense]
MEKYIFFYETTGCLHPAKISTLEAEEEIRQLACKPGSVWPRFDPERGSHSSGTAFACRLAQPTRMTGPETGCERAFARPVSSLFGLAPGGVYLAAAVTRSAVGSYPTLSPLPCGAHGGLLSVALSLGSPPPDVIRHRISVEPGLSSPYRLSTLVKRGCPANWHGLHNHVPQRKPPKSDGQD